MVRVSRDACEDPLVLRGDGTGPLPETYVISADDNVVIVMVVVNMTAVPGGAAVWYSS